MPNQTGITVKNAAGTDVVYSPTSPSSGDGNPAMWRALALSPMLIGQPAFEMSIKGNSSGTARSVQSRYGYPVMITDANTGRQLLVNSSQWNLSGNLPKNLSTQECLDAFTQFSNLLVSALVRQMIVEQQAAT